MKIDLGWGNSVAVREAFLDTYHGNPLVFAKEELLKFDYPEHDGDLKLVEITRDVVERQSGRRYKHVFLVNGATGGCVIALRAYAQQDIKFCMTRKAPFYIRYPKMIEAAGLNHVQHTSHNPTRSTVTMLDLPSNPLALMDPIDMLAPNPTIIDAVYYNNVYMPWRPLMLPKHDVMIGSYSKLTGLNGIRIGWLATDDDLLAARFQELITSEYCGLSESSSTLLKHMLQGFEWERFEKSARFKLDCNRTEWELLERFFDGTSVPSIGMFYYGPMDPKAQQIFEKAGVSWTKGSALGTDDSFGRFNLGQSVGLIEQAVKAVLKADKIR